MDGMSELDVPPPNSRLHSPAQPLTPALSPEYRGEGAGQLPARFQRLRARGWSMPSGGRCCSRPGRWGNPLVGEWAGYYFARWGQQHLLGYDNARLADLLTDARLSGRELELHLPSRWRLITTARTFFADVTDLRGRPLGCFCALNEPCHVDSLLVLANELTLRRQGIDPVELLRWNAGSQWSGIRDLNSKGIHE